MQVGGLDGAVSAGSRARRSAGRNAQACRMSCTAGRRRPEQRVPGPGLPRPQRQAGPEEPRGATSPDPDRPRRRGRGGASSTAGDDGARAPVHGAQLARLQSADTASGSHVGRRGEPPARSDGRSTSGHGRRPCRRQNENGSEDRTRGAQRWVTRRVTQCAPLGSLPRTPRPRSRPCDQQEHLAHVEWKSDDQGPSRPRRST